MGKTKVNIPKNGKTQENLRKHTKTQESYRGNIGKHNNTEKTQKTYQKHKLLQGKHRKISGNMQKNIGNLPGKRWETYKSTEKQKKKEQKITGKTSGNKAHIVRFISIYLFISI